MLIGEMLDLRPVTAADAKLLTEWFNDPEYLGPFFNVTPPLGSRDGEEPQQRGSVIGRPYLPHHAQGHGRAAGPHRAHEPVYERRVPRAGDLVPGPSEVPAQGDSSPSGVAARQPSVRLHAGRADRG